MLYGEVYNSTEYITLTLSKVPDGCRISRRDTVRYEIYALV